MAVDHLAALVMAFSSLSTMLSIHSQDQNDVSTNVNSGRLAEHQLTRPDDIKLVLDQLPAIEEQILAIQGQMDRKRIGMGGHSFGAHTTQMIGGLSLRDFRNRNRITADDPRPKALLMISPQGRGGQIDDESWKSITRPTMVVTGTNDQGRM